MNKKLAGGIILLAVITLTGWLGFHFYPQKTDHDRVPAALPITNPNQSPGDQEAKDLKSPYVLTIEGTSTHIEGKQKLKMDEWRNEVREMASKRPQEIVLNGPADKKAVSLTFDDGPDNIICSQVLAVLEKQKIKASFFVTGQQAERFPEMVKKMNSQGHLVLSHAYSHRQLDQCTNMIIDKEVFRTDELIKKQTGRIPAGLRPPYGAINQASVDQLSKDGKLVILWSIDTLDWAGDDASAVAANVLNHVRPGDIILMHSTTGRNNTVAALPQIIAGLREKGYEMLRLDQLLGKTL